MIECSGCGAQLIVHMDGRVEYQGVKEISQVRDEEAAEGKASEKGAELPAFEPMREFELAEDATEMRTVARAQDLVPPSGTGSAHRMPEDDILYDANREYTKEVLETRDEEPAGDDFESPPALPVDDGDGNKEFLGADSGEEEAVFEEAEAEVNDKTEVTAPLEPPQDLFPDFDRQDPSEAPVAYNAGPVSSSPDLGDIAKFGNSEASGGREGPLRYNLFIEGIDTVDVREAFREALTDRKLMWDTDQILRSVRNGRVNIPNVAPTKAYILITRLRGMPVQVRWEQYATSQA